MNFFLLLLASFAAQAAPSKSAPAMIEAFYRKYLGAKNASKLNVPFSQSFRALKKEDAAACAKFAKGDICGFSADADIYLDAQDFDPKLTFAKAGFKAVESEPGKVTATFNLFPKDKENAASNQRTLVYVMTTEKDSWVVDDIFSHGESARKQMRDEIDAFKKTK